MSTGWTFAACGLLSYLLGAVPFGLLIARSRGVDIRKEGSGNIGATNVFRTLGKGAAILTFALDVFKGFVPAFVLPILCRDWLTELPLPLLAIVSGACAIAGHNWPVYLRFKGGKGVATSTGVLLGVAPIAAAAGLMTWIMVFKLSRYVSLASILAALAVACTGWVQWTLSKSASPVIIQIVLTTLCLLIILRHSANIGRLLSGTEHGFVSEKQSTDTGRKTPSDSDANSEDATKQE